jgi:ABC-type dipeptide/oligopeptide/nickel transport system permease component
MGQYLVRRLSSAAVTILLISVVVFFLIHLVPGNPARMLMGERASAYSVANLTRALGLNLPLYSQYLRFWSDVFAGTMGTSLVYQVPVLGLVESHLVVTLFLIAYSSVIAIVVGVPVGLFAAYHRDRLGDHIIRGVLLTLAGTPTFWLGTLLVLLFTLRLHLLPVAGYGQGFVGHIQSLFLPALVLAASTIALIARDLRATVIDVLERPYVELARLKGISDRRVMVRHVLRTSVTNTLTLVSLNVSYLLAGAVVVEQLFSVPGAGSLLLSSVDARDYPVIQAITFVYAVLVVFVNLITDLCYPLLDPRVRLT